MASTNSKTFLLVYTSFTGNTETLMTYINDAMQQEGIETMMTRFEDISLDTIPRYDGLVIGTYTWGSGEIPEEMQDIYEYMEQEDTSHLITAVAGTGDTAYPHFCGAVDEFKAMLYYHTNLAVTLKVEASPQAKDIEKTKRFAHLIKDRIYSSQF